MATREALQARVDKIRREVARREVESLSTSERQAAYITGRDVLVIVAERDDAEDRDAERDDGERGDDGGRRKLDLDGDSTSRRQAAKITRGRS
ncbi:hypothetical protein [Microbacterium lacticum]